MQSGHRLRRRPGHCDDVSGLSCIIAPRCEAGGSEHSCLKQLSMFCRYNKTPILRICHPVCAEDRFQTSIIERVVVSYQRHLFWNHLSSRTTGTKYLTLNVILVEKLVLVISVMMLAEGLRVVITKCVPAFLPLCVSLTMDTAM